MLSSTMPEDLRAEKGYYPVGGCGGNIAWHTEDDTLEIADRDNLLRDMRVYAGSAFRAANAPVHPLDFRATVAQIEDELGCDRRASRRARRPGRNPGANADAALGAGCVLRGGRQGDSIEAARPFNDALLKIGRSLVRVLYSATGTYRQDPALNIPLLPEFAAAADAIGTVPEGVLRTEFLRVRNRLDEALGTATELAIVTAEAP